jgi:hypothetical protein
MSKADEDRARQKFADNMREASARAKVESTVAATAKKLAQKKKKTVDSPKADE